MNSPLIMPLNNNVHLQICQNIDKFWGSKGKGLLAYHHPSLPLLFPDYCLISKSKQTICSYLYASHNNESAFIQVMATRIGQYRKGHASTLIKRLIEVARRDKLKSIFLYRTEANHLSRLFFESMGFKETEALITYPGKKRVIMVLKLKSNC